MQNNFNNTINQLYNFEIEPSQQNWEDIECRLPQKNNKKIMMYWWHLPVLLSVAFLFIVYSYPKNGNKFLASINKEITRSSNIQFDFKNDNKLQNINTNTKILNTNKINQFLNKPLVKSVEKVMFYKSNNNYTNQTTNNNSSSKLNNSSTSTSIKTEQFDDENKTEPPTNTVNILDYNITNVLKNKDSILPKTATIVVVKNDTLITEITIKNKITKKPLFSLAVGYGANYVSRNNILGVNNNLLNQPTFSNVSTGSSSGLNAINNNLKLPLFNTGNHFIIGVNIEYPLTKKILLKSGLQYSYLQNNIGVNNNQINEDNLSVGSQINYKNTLHLIALPIDIKYCLNPTFKHKISFLGGLNTSYVIKKNWLFVNDNIQRYEKNSSLINSLILGLQMGASINFNNKFSVDIQAVKTITTIQKTLSNYYLQQLNVLLNIPLKSQKK